VSSFACLYANLYGIKNPYENPRSKEAKFDMAKKAAEFTQKDFVPND
jgi:hypothetical protein